MRSDFFGNNGKSARSNKHRIPTVAGSWLSNAGKSLGYSTMDILSDLMPSTIESVKTASQITKDTVNSMRDFKTQQARLNQAFNISAYSDIAKTLKTNAWEDLKSGKFNNTDRDIFGMDDYDLGSDEDYVANNQKSSSDKSDGQQPQIVINSNIDKRNPMVIALQSQTKVIADTSKTSIELDKRNTQLTLNYLQKMQSNTTQLMASINSNIGVMSKSLTDIMGKHAAVSMKYYDDSMAIFKSINDSVKLLADKAASIGRADDITLKEKPYENVLDTVINARGSLNLEAYLKLVGKQANKAIDNNLITSSLKNMVSQTDVLKMMAANPLKVVSDTIVKQFIPAYIKQTAGSFDNMVKETMTGLLYKVRGLKFSKAGNPLFSTISDIFGIGNSMKTDVDRSNYNRGAVAWDGISHKTLNDVIPTYLRQIAAAVTNTQELAFDYNKGTWDSLKNIRDNQQKEYDRRMLGDHSSTLSDFKEYLSSSYQFTNTKQSDRVSKQMEKLLIGLNKSDGMRNFRKVRHGDGSVTDDIADILGRGSDDPVVRMIRGFFEGSNRSYTANVFGTQSLSNRARMDRYVRELEASGIANNTHLTDKNLRVDANLKYNQDDTVARGSGIFNNEDKFGYSQSDYLRNILKVLTNGIKVFNMGGRPRGGGEFLDPNASIAQKLRDSSTELENENAKRRFRINGTDYSREDIQRGIRRGRHVVNADGYTDHNIVTDAQATSLRRTQVANEEAREQQQGKDSWLSQMGLISGDGNLNKLVNKFNEYMQKPSKVLTDLFKKSENFLFNLIFEGGETNPGGSFLKRAFDGMKVQFRKFSDFMDKKILQPMYETMFGENGIIAKFKETQLGQDMQKGLKNAVDYLLGAKDEDGNRHGGMFSSAANEVKDSFRYVGQMISGKEYTDSKGQTHPAIENSIWANIKEVGNQASRGIKQMFGMDPDSPMFESSGKYNNVILDGVDNFWTMLKKRTSDFMDDVFGPPSDENTRRQQVTKFSNDMKQGFPKIAAYAAIGGVGASMFGGSVGFISSLFLPGGLFTGALMGSVIGMISQSDQLKDFLFGKQDENGTRVGNIITRETMDFLKDNKKGLFIGAGLGWLKSAGVLGFMPAWFLPGGPIGGALAGAAVSMVTNTDAFQRLMFGDTDENGNHNGKGFLRHFKGTFGDNAFLDAGLGAGVGVLGSFFLPGGPITGALIGAAAGITLQSEQFKSFMFGKEGENGKRQGGAVGFIKEKVVDPMATSLMDAQSKLIYFIEQKMALPLVKAMAPFKAEIRFVKERIFDSFTAIKDKIGETFENYVSKPIGDFIQDKFLKPLGSLFNKLFGFVGKMIGTIISKPFTVLGGIGDVLYGSHQRRGISAYRQDNVNYMLGGTSDEKRARKERGDRLGVFGEYNSEGTRIGKGRLQRIFGGAKNYITAASKDEAKYNDRGAYYNRDGSYQQDIDDFTTNSDRRLYNTKLKIAARSGVDVRSLLPKDFLKRNPDYATKFGSDIVDLNAGSRSRIARSNTTRLQEPVETGDEQLTSPLSGMSLGSLMRGEIPVSDNGTVAESGTPTIQTTGRGRGRNNRNRTRANNRRSSNRQTVSSSPINTSNESTHVSGYSGETFGARTSNANLSQSQRDGALVKIMKYAKEIAEEVKGQLDGVGSNVYKIRLLTQKSSGTSDDDLTGSANRDRLGFFGKFKRMMRHPAEMIGDIITAPFRKVGDIIGGTVTKLKEGFDKIIQIPKFIGKGLLAIGKGLGQGLLSLLDIPKQLLGIAMEVVKVTGATFVEGLKLANSTLMASIKVAGTAISESIKAITPFFKAVFEGFGKGLVSIFSGFGNLIGNALGGLGKLLYSTGLVTAETLKMVGKGLVGVTKFVGSTAFSLATSPFKLIGDGIGYISSKLGGKSLSSLQHVYIEGGWIDRVGYIGSNTGTPSISPNTTTTRGYNQSPIGRDNRDTLDGQLDLDDVFDGSRSATTVSVDTAETLTAMSILEQRREQREAERAERAEIEADRDEVVDNGGMSWWQKIFRSKKNTPEDDYRARMIIGQEQMNSSLVGHALNWASIFSKKGLFTMLFLAGLPKILEFTDWLFKSGTFDKIYNAITTTGSQLIESIGLISTGLNNLWNGLFGMDDNGRGTGMVTGLYQWYLDSKTPNSNTILDNPDEWFKRDNPLKDDKTAFKDQFGYDVKYEQTRSNLGKMLGIDIPVDEWSTIIKLQEKQIDTSEVDSLTKDEIKAIDHYNHNRTGTRLSREAYVVLFKKNDIPFTSEGIKSLSNIKSYNKDRWGDPNYVGPITQRLNNKAKYGAILDTENTSIKLDNGMVMPGGKGDTTQTSPNGTTVMKNGGVYFSQNDNTWGRKSYRNSGGTIASSGCGPTSLAMALSTITGQYITPDQVAEQSSSLGYACAAGTSWGAMTKIPQLAGISVTSIKGSAGYDGDRIGIGTDKASQIKQLLSSGVPMILSGRRLSSTKAADSPFTNGGHFVVAMGMSGDDIIINDPRGDKYSKAYNFDTVMSEARSAWAYPSYDGRQVQINTGYSSPTGTTTSSTLGESPISAIFGGLTNAIMNPINKFLYGESFNETTTQANATGYTYQNGSLVPTTVRDAINLKLTEMIKQSETGNNYAAAKNDFNASTGQPISPSIGVMQWRGTYAKELMNRIFNSSQQMKANSDAQYFANQVNWQDNTPWSDAQLKRFGNFMSSNSTIINPIQDNYARQYVDDRLTNMLYKYGFDTGIISDPRSAVFLGEIAQTGPANIQKFLQRKYGGSRGYDKSKQIGTTELDNVYNQLISPGNSYYGDHLSTYKSRLDRTYNELKSWSPTVQAGKGEESIEYNNDVVNYDKYNKLNAFAMTSNIKNKVVSENGYIHSIINKLGEIVNELRGTNQGINKFNDKEFKFNVPNPSNNIYSSTNNNIVNSNGKPITSSSTKTTRKVDRSLDQDQINLARKIAAGYSS